MSGLDKRFHFEEASKHEGIGYVLTEEVFRKAPAFTELAFNRLLAWLDDGVESHGERYLEIRRRLVSYFERRNRADADELADETLNRIGRTLEQSGVIATRPPARYCYVVARFVLLEDFRRTRKYVALDEPKVWRAAPGSDTGGEPDEALAIREQRLDCLDRCLQQLRPEQRDLVVAYYRDTRRQKIDGRRALASQLGITLNALGIRVYRIRDALMACVELCRNHNGFESRSSYRGRQPDTRVRHVLSTRTTG
jgi:DNA-directed RNA polymerase specialized sigma24 family protein